MRFHTRSRDGSLTGAIHAISLRNWRRPFSSGEQGNTMKRIEKGGESYVIPDGQTTVPDGSDRSKDYLANGWVVAETNVIPPYPGGKQLEIRRS